MVAIDFGRYKILVSITFAHRPHEAMVFNTVKACLHYS